MNIKRFFIILLVFVVAFVVAAVLYIRQGNQSDNNEVSPNATEVEGNATEGACNSTEDGNSEGKNVPRSMLPCDFVDIELADYEIIGKWYVITDDGYVIARKDGQLWAAYYNKADKTVGVLIPLKERVEDGDTIIYCEESPGNEYMIIRDKGLCIYGNNGLDPIVWPREF